MKQRFVNIAFALLVSAAAWAQGGTNSPYSQYGLGQIADRSQGFSRGMNGVGQGLRIGNAVNTLNPASYSSVDSLTMLFDVAMSGQITNMKEGDASVNAHNAAFEYATGLFRVAKNVGVSFGISPLTTVGYNYSTETFRDEVGGKVSQTFSGDGGLRQAFVGAGWRIVGPLSVGFNFGYVWGSIDRTAASGSTTYVEALTKTFSASVSSYNLEFGLQWDQPLGKKDNLTLGLTYGLGHSLNADATYTIGKSAADTTYHATNALDLPTTLSAGLAWTHNKSWTVAADVTYQKWGKLDMPDYDAHTKQYAMMSGLLKDRYQVNAGFDYVPNAKSRNYFKRVHYRMGAGYATPYYKVNGADGAKEYSVSAGFAFPLQNAYNNRSVLNISAQWVHASAKDLITENTFRINIGLTFNERWFMKWKVE